MESWAMTLKEPNWKPCTTCGELTAENPRGPTVCFDCAEKAVKAEEALAAFEETVPQAFHWASFDSPLLAERTSAAARARARHACRSTRVVLMGQAGVGKTSLVVAMARHWALFGGRARVQFASSLKLGSVRMRGHGSEAFVNDCTYCPLLVLDDLGSEKDVPSSPVAEVIHERHAHGSPTWITTWMKLEEAKTRYGDGIARRIFQGAVMIDCEGKGQ